MSFLFKPRQKTPAELVKTAKDGLSKLESDSDNKKVLIMRLLKRQAVEELSRVLVLMKNVLYGDGGDLAAHLNHLKR